MTDMPKKPVAAIIGAGPARSRSLGSTKKGGMFISTSGTLRCRLPATSLISGAPAEGVASAPGEYWESRGARLHAARRYDGRIRAEFRMPEAIAREYNGGFIGLIRWGLYRRMIDAFPEGVLHLSISSSA